MENRFIYSYAADLSIVMPRVLVRVSEKYFHKNGRFIKKLLKETYTLLTLPLRLWPYWTIIFL